MATWNAFVANSRNGLFLFNRGYMDYHADRFKDHSLLFFDDDDQLVAVLPSDERDGVLRSHGGLTFGGVLCGDDTTTAPMLSIFDALIAYMRKRRIRELIYKAIPHIYHRVPSEEDLYALFLRGAVLYRRDVSATIQLGHRLKPRKGRKSAIKRSHTMGTEVVESTDFEGFMRIAADALKAKYGKSPTHTGAELALLASRFPSQIRLFAAMRDGMMLGGVVMYESPRVAHAQYIAATQLGQDVGAIDRIVDHLLSVVYQGDGCFDFGISTEDEGQYLNEGLASYKQSFGARATVCDFYRLELTA